MELIGSGRASKTRAGLLCGQCERNLLAFVTLLISPPGNGQIGVRFRGKEDQGTEGGGEDLEKCHGSRRVDIYSVSFPEA